MPFIITKKEWEAEEREFKKVQKMIKKKEKKELENWLKKFHKEEKFSKKDWL